MTLTMNIPDDLAAELGTGFQNLSRAALEALAVEAYEKDILSLEQVRRMLELESRWEAQEVLSRHGAWPGYCAEEILADARNSSSFRQVVS
jgi:predicted HTH domain antitoxin